MPCGTVKAGRGRRAETVPCLGRGTRWPPVVVPEAAPARFEPGRLRESSLSIFLRMACVFGWGDVSVQLLGKRRTSMPFAGRLGLPGTLGASVSHARWLRVSGSRGPLPLPARLHRVCAGCAHSTVQRVADPVTRSRLMTHLVALGLALASLCKPVRASGRGARDCARGREVARARLRVSAPG